MASLLTLISVLVLTSILQAHGGHHNGGNHHKRGGNQNGGNQNGGDQKGGNDPKGTGHDPTLGFTSLPLQQSNIEIQRPYNLPLASRYSFVDGVHKLWVLSTDKPHFRTSGTLPRTEIRIKGYDYASGVWQFEGQAYVPKGTTGTCIMQIHGGKGLPTVLMLMVYDGALKFYRRQVLADNIYDRWFQVNVIHDITGGQTKVFIDGVLKFTKKETRKSTFYFKAGVYTQHQPSHYMESRWKNIKVLKMK